MKHVMPTRLLTVLSVGMLCVPALAEDEALTAAWNAVVAKYPTTNELRQRIDAYKSEHSAEFAAAKADFDLAVRSMIGLNFPPSPYAMQRAGGPRKDPMPALIHRDKLTNSIARLRAENGGDYQQYADFYEAHFEEIALEQSPAHRYVYLDCLLNGWQDWSSWTTPKLMEVRERHPDVYLKYSLEKLFVLRSLNDYEVLTDYMPVLLPLLNDASLGRKTRLKAESVTDQLASAAKDSDVMKYCMLKYLATNEENFLSVSAAIDDRLPTEARRAFWEPYLSTDNEVVRLYAVGNLGETIRKPRAGEAARPEDAALAERLRQIAENDPSPLVKQSARYKLRLYDTSDTRPTHGRLGPEGGSFP